MKTIQHRLLKLVDLFSKGNVSGFAEKAGIVQATFHNYIKGRNPNIESLIAIRNKFKINIDWLLTGEGKMLMDEKEPDATASEMTVKVIPTPNNCVATQHRYASDDTLTEVMTWMDRYPGHATLTSRLKADIIREEQAAINGMQIEPESEDAKKRQDKEATVMTNNK